jgi:hypothetical protein
MHMPQVNLIAVLVAGIVIFMLGGLWYSPALFAKRWVALQGKSEEEMRAASKPSMYIEVFVCGLITAFVMAVILNHFIDLTMVRAVCVAFLCWLGFTGVTSYGTALFSAKPKALWLIDSAYNLVAFVLAAIVLALPVFR